MRDREKKVMNREGLSSLCDVGGGKKCDGDGWLASIEENLVSVLCCFT